MNMYSRSSFSGQPGVDPVRFRAGTSKLHGRLYRPAGAPKAIAVLHGAVGVPQAYYARFATWLSTERGIACLTYDYSDFGASRRGGTAASRVTLTDWGLTDQPAAAAEARRLVPDAPLWVLGHSFGGAMLAFHPAGPEVARIVTVASGLPGLGDHPWPYRALALAFWYGHVPLATRLAGYLPARLTGFGADLPAGVYWQWRDWCLARGFYLADVGRRLPLPDPNAVTAPAKIVAVADDDMVPPAAVWRLMAMYPEARKRQLVLRPAEHGLRRIGHLGPFHARSAALWPALVA